MKGRVDESEINVAVVEDDDEIRHSLVLIVDGSPGYRCRQGFGNAEDALRSLPGNPPDVILMDIGLPGMSGIEATRLLHDLLPESDVVMLTVMDDDDAIFNSLCAGASGYLMKSTPPAQLLQSIDEVCHGGSPMSASIARRVVRSFQAIPPGASVLSPRESEILQHLCDGANYRVIAEKLFISGHTVRTHIKNIYEKLQVNSRAEAVKKALSERLI